ncbi:hypothetical protein [Streptomyces sp. NPDC001970]
MSGFDGDRVNDGLDAIDTDGGLWSASVDYLSGWLEARDVADRLNRAVLGVGLELSDVRAVAGTTADGRGIVRVTGWTGAVAELARLLELVAEQDGRAA